MDYQASEVGITRAMDDAGNHYEIVQTRIWRRVRHNPGAMFSDGPPALALRDGRSVSRLSDGRYRLGDLLLSAI
jgi:hypothetical protein